MWNWFRIGLAILLVATALLKLTTSASLLRSGGLLSTPAILALAIGFEFAAAVFIVFAAPRSAYHAAVFVFSTLAAVALWAWWTKSDCNCFGPQTPKGLPLLIDIGCLAALAAIAQSASSERNHEASKRVHSSIHSAVLAIGVGLFAGGFAFWKATEETQAGEMPTWFGENLIGQPLPLLREAFVRSAVPETGDVLLVMLRPDCDHCRELATNWNDNQGQSEINPTIIGISVSEREWTIMPGLVSADPVSEIDQFVLRWKSEEEPFIAAPTLIAVRDRMVIAVKSSDDVDRLIEESDWVSTLFGHQ